MIHSGDIPFWSETLQIIRNDITDNPPQTWPASAWSRLSSASWFYPPPPPAGWSTSPLYPVALAAHRKWTFTSEWVKFSSLLFTSQQSVTEWELPNKLCRLKKSHLCKKRGPSQCEFTPFLFYTVALCQLSPAFVSFLLLSFKLICALWPFWIERNSSNSSINPKPLASYPVCLEETILDDWA